MSFPSSRIGISALAAILLMAPYRLERLMTFLNPWAHPWDSGFQLIQALIAIGRGATDAGDIAVDAVAAAIVENAVIVVVGVALVSEQVAIGVVLPRVGYARAVVVVGAEAVAITVIVGVVGAWVAQVACIVPVAVILQRVV